MTTEHPNSWAAEAIRRVRTGGPHLTPTPLRPLPLPAIRDVEIYLKDESAHPTGSMKYRLVRAMFCEAIASGAIRSDTPVIAATSGAVAVAGAHFARLLGLVFTAVVPATTPADVLARIEGEGGRWQVGERPPAAVQEEARALTEQFGGHFLDHFSDAERAVAGCGEPTVADEIFDQMSGEPHPIPEWIVTGAGTGATSAAIGRRLRRHGDPTRLAVVDPENSAYFPAWASGCGDYTTGMPSRIPGIGRPRTEPGFLPTVIDLMIPVPDAASIAAMRWLRTAPTSGERAISWPGCAKRGRGAASSPSSATSLIRTGTPTSIRSGSMRGGSTPRRTRPTSSCSPAPGTGRPGSDPRDSEPTP